MLVQRTSSSKVATMNPQRTPFFMASGGLGVYLINWQGRAEWIFALGRGVERGA